MLDSEDFVTCEECGLLYKWITPSHLRSAHGITEEEYLLRHPGSPLRASSIRLGNWKGTSTGSKWEGLSEEEELDRKKRISDSVKSYQSSRSEEDISKQSKERSKSLRSMWAGREEEDRSDILSRSIHSEESKDKAAFGRRKAWSEKSQEEKDLFLSSGLHSESSKARKKEGVQRYWDNVGPEEKSNRMSSVARGNSRSKTSPEVAVEDYLESRFPGKWFYSGDGSNLQGVNTGGLVPDFISSSKKSVVEVLGDHWHSEYRKGRTEEEEEAYIKGRYSKQGLYCYIVWEHDAYFSDELDKIFSR